MKTPTLTVRTRLLGLCIGLLVLLGGASVTLGVLLVRNQAFQNEQEQQYDRFERAFNAEQALSVYRNRGSKLNSAILARDLDGERRAQIEFEDASLVLLRQLKDLARTEPETAATAHATLQEVEDYRNKAVAAILSGNRGQIARYSGLLQQRLDLVETMLHGLSVREQAASASIASRERSRSRGALDFAMVILLITAAGALLLTIVIVRSILAPLRATTDAMRQVNLGNTAVEMPPVTPDEFGDMAFALRQYRDQTERLRRVAYHDPLTGLGNRARLEDHVQRLIERLRRSQGSFALLFVDLDNFRAVNDKFGHKAGDRYIYEANLRLRRFMPSEAMLCRYGGDKFTIVVERLEHTGEREAQLQAQAEQILAGLSQAYPFGSHLLNMSVSIGIAVFPDDGDTVEQIISSADAAMYVAKKQGRNTARFAGTKDAGNLRRNLAIASDIRRGLEHGEFEPHYQPVIDVDRRMIVGAEALMRWNHPERGLLPPSEFIHVAEEAGLINQLGELCLLMAHEQAREWAARGRNLRIAVNLSVRQVHDGKILSTLRALRPTSTSAPNLLVEFELTESALLDTTEYSNSVLSEIKTLGFGIGLDDFGTGYSSFSYLQRLPIDKIKIDRLFVTSMNVSKEAIAIVSATMTLAQTLNLSVVGEGVETAEQMRQLRLLGCRLQQGYLFTRALPASAFEAWSDAFEKADAIPLVSEPPAERGGSDLTPGSAARN